MIYGRVQGQLFPLDVTLVFLFHSDTHTHARTHTFTPSWDCSSQSSSSNFQLSQAVYISRYSHRDKTSGNEIKWKAKETNMSTNYRKVINNNKHLSGPVCTWRNLLYRLICRQLIMVHYANYFWYSIMIDKFLASIGWTSN